MGVVRRSRQPCREPRRCGKRAAPGPEKLSQALSDELGRVVRQRTPDDVELGEQGLDATVAAGAGQLVQAVLDDGSAGPSVGPAHRRATGHAHVFHECTDDPRLVDPAAGQRDVPRQGPRPYPRRQHEPGQHEVAAARWVGMTQEEPPLDGYRSGQAGAVAQHCSARPYVIDDREGVRAGHALRWEHRALDVEPRSQLPRPSGPGQPRKVRSVTRARDTQYALWWDAIGWESHVEMPPCSSASGNESSVMHPDRQPAQ